MRSGILSKGKLIISACEITAIRSSSVNTVFEKYKFVYSSDSPPRVVGRITPNQLACKVAENHTFRKIQRKGQNTAPNRANANFCEKHAKTHRKQSQQHQSKRRGRNYLRWISGKFFLHINRPTGFTPGRWTFPHHTGRTAMVVLINNPQRVHFLFLVFPSVKFNISNFLKSSNNCQIKSGRPIPSRILQRGLPAFAR